MMRTAGPLRKPRLLAGCALAACLAAVPSTAGAQGFQGTPTTVAGEAPIFNTAADYTQVVVRSAETVINWAPFDVGTTGTIDFLPEGAIGEFTEPSGSLAYTVLNRILPSDELGNAVSRPVAFNGTVIGLNGNFPGGNIWFYSPTGIIAGPTAVFSVGGLILTTNDVAFVPGPSGSIYGPGGLVEFQGPANSAGFVDIQAGARIDGNANPLGAGYVALVAPRVTQAGTVQADGPIAYLAAEQVDMTINGGLFDFVLTVGTTDANGVVHTGITAGPASTSAADQQRISMVALPKNDALTMLLSGEIGYSPAISAANEGSSIVLAAGFDTDAPTDLPANRLGSIEIGDTTFSNALAGYASDSITVAPATTAAEFQATTELHALNRIDIVVENDERVGATDLFLYAGEPGQGGTISLRALDGDPTDQAHIDVAGILVANASGSGVPFVTAPAFLDAAGGQVELGADGGRISAASTLVLAEGFANSGDPLGGLGTGGAIDLTVSNGGTIASPTIQLYANGAGGESAVQGGSGTGGSVVVADLGGQLDFDSVSIGANGFGGGGNAGGAGFGGNVSIAIAGQAQNWASLFVSADAAAGLRNLPDGRSGAATASPDAIGLTVTGTGELAITDTAVLTANSYMAYNNADGLVGQAGGIALTAADGGALTVGGSGLSAHASALFFDDAIEPDPFVTPEQLGGNVSILADGGRIAVAHLNAGANAVGASASATAGAARGGTVVVGARVGGEFLADDGVGTSLVEITANAFGMPGASAADAYGGTARLQAQDGTVRVNGAAFVTANAVSEQLTEPAVGQGFAASGGTASLDLLAGSLGTGLIEALDLTVQATGDARAIQFGGIPPAGGDPIEGDGGIGAGGNASIFVQAGTLSVGTAAIDSSGRGGASAAIDGAVAFQSGDGLGGTSQLMQSGGNAAIGTLALVSNGTGGGGAPTSAGSALAALAGSGTGGTATMQLSGGSLQTTGTTLEALGIGAAGMDHAGAGAASDGGAGTGGSVTLQTPGGWAGDFTTTTLTLLANGMGGAGGTSAGGVNGDGGAGTGTSAAIDLADGSFALGTVTIEATGTGGDGETGGEGSGGLARFAVVDTAGPTGTRNLGDLTIEANGVAGLSGGLFPEQSNAGTIELVANAFNAASGVVIDGSAVLNSLGVFAGPTSGVTIDVSGALLAIGGSLTVEVAGDIDIAAAQALSAGAEAYFSAERSFASTGLVATDGPLTVLGATGIAAEQLSSGGATLLEANSGPLVVSVDLASVGPVTAVAESIDIASLGALTFAQLDATAGPLSVTAAGNLSLTDANATGNVSLRSTGGALAATGTIDAGGSVTLEGQLGVSVPTLISGGTTSLRATGGAATVSVDLASIGPVTAVAESIDIVSLGALTFAELDATAGPLSVTAAGNLSLAEANASGNLSLRSTAGALAATGTVDAGGNATLEGALGVSVPRLSSGGTTLLSATGGAVSVSEDLISTGAVTAVGQSVNVVSSGGLFFDEASATAGDVTIMTAGGLAGQQISASGLVDLRSTAANIQVLGNVSGAVVRLDAAAGVTAEADLTSAGALDVISGGTFTLAGTAAGTAISLTSTDIALGTDAAIGSRGLTQTLSIINSNPAQTTFVGGVAESSGYSLDQTEAAQLFADESISIGVGGDGNITIRDLAMAFGPTSNIGTGGQLEISTAAVIGITGNVALTTSSADDTFLIDPTLIELNTDTGSIAMLNASGDPLGRLAMVGNTIAIATGNTLSQLATAPDMPAINALLATPGGTAQPLQAGTIMFDVVDGLYIQNTGTSEAFADRRGFAASGVDIDTASTSTQIAINGQILTASGPVGGLDTVELIQINGITPAAGGQFNSLSSVNGCVIGANCALVPPGPPTSVDLDSPIPGPEGSPLPSPLIELAGTDPLIAPPLVDEPITGVGNDDLWEPRCEDDENVACPAPDRQP